MRQRRGTGRTLGLLALRVLGAALLGSVETEVLEEEDLAVLAAEDGLLGLGSNTVGEEGDLLGEELLELGSLRGRWRERDRA